MGRSVLPAVGHSPRAEVTAVALMLGAGLCAAVATASPALATTCAITNGTHHYTDLETAVNAAHKGDTLKVSGTCSDAPGGNGSAVTVATSLTIDGSTGATVEPAPAQSGRVFLIDSGVTVTLHGLTITGGGGDLGTGGGILNSGKLTLSDSTVTGNSQTINGAGVYNNSGASLTLADTTVSDNNSAGDGGGIYNLMGTVTLNGSTVEDDNAGDGESTGTGDGGGIYNYAGRMMLTGSTVYFNASTQNGGGIDNASVSASSGGGTLTLNDDTLVNDTADYGDGGGVFNDGNLTLAGTTVTMNNAISGNGFGGGVYNASDWNLIATGSAVTNNAGEYGGGVYNNTAGFASLTGSTVSGNQSELAGGGIGNEGDLELTNATVANNSAVDSAGGIFSDAGATLVLTMVTISNNSGYGGGGLYNDGALTVAGTIIAGNSASGGTPQDCDETTSGTSSDSGYNLIGNSDGCFKVASTDITDTSALLGALARNGGPTETLLPLVGSPAINAIPARVCESAAFLNSAHPTDQRGVSRPQGGACEIGSVEVATPVITRFSPTSGRRRTKVTIRGHHFAGTDGVTAVYVDGFSADFKIVSGTKIIVTVPVRAGTGRIMVEGAGGSFTTRTKFKVT